MTAITTVNYVVNHFVHEGIKFDHNTKHDTLNDARELHHLEIIDHGTIIFKTTMIMTSEYRFNQSRQILADLARTHLRSPLPVLRSSFESTQGVTPFEFIDGSLSLLGQLYATQDDHLRKEFKQQQDFINEKFEQQQYEAGRRDERVDEKFGRVDRTLAEINQRFDRVDQRFEEIEQRFDRVDQRFEEIEQRFDRVDQRFEEVEQRFDAQFSEMRVIMFNSLSYRPHDRIQPVTLFKDRRLYKPDEKSFPTTVKAFWKLQQRENAYKRFHLLQFYAIEGYQHWNTETDASDADADSDSDDATAESLTLEDAARHYPSKCLEVLAARIGLHYDKICTEMKRLQEHRQRTTAQPVKRPQEDVVSSTQDETSKRARPTTPPTGLGLPVRHPGPVQVRNSQGSTDIVSETDLQKAEQQSQGSTNVLSLESDD
jgi:hypothetical protein